MVIAVLECNILWGIRDWSNEFTLKLHGKANGGVK